MRALIYVCFCTFLTIVPALAQSGPAATTGRTQPKPDSPPQQKSREEIDALFAAAQKRQDAENERRTKLMAHWTFAVCVGCGVDPRPFKAVVTNPLRVLAGVPAWMDDERGAGRRMAARTGQARRRVAILEGV